jgi:glutamine amidotransferase
VSRLVAYRGAPTRVAPLVFEGERSLYRQSWAPGGPFPGSGNADGYGVVWYARGFPRRLARPHPIWHDAGLQRTLESITSRCIVAALRDGSPGPSADSAGLLPLTYDRWSFVLDGFVPHFRERHMRALRGPLPDHLYAMIEGASDSETLFLLAIAALENGATPVEALCASAGAVSSTVGGEEAQLAMLLTDGATLTVLLTSTVNRTNSLYLARRCAQAPRGVALASEPLDPGGSWERVPGHSSVVIGAGGDVCVRPVGA